jgi:hypothetical protein
VTTVEVVSFVLEIAVNRLQIVLPGIVSVVVVIVDHLFWVKYCLNDMVKIFNSFSFIEIYLDI